MSLSVSISPASGLVFGKQLLGDTGALAGAAELLAERERGARRGRVRLVGSTAELAALEPVWDRLLESSATRSPFLRWDWMWLWWSLFGSEYRLAVVVVDDAFGAPEALAPLVLGHGTTGGHRHLHQLCWLGGLGAVEGEVMDFLVPAGREAELTPLLCEGIDWLMPEWEGVRLNKIPEDSPNLPILLACLGQFAAKTGVVNRHASRFTVLAGSWEAYAAQHSGRWRRNLRKRWESLTGDGGVRQGLAGRTMEPGQAMDELKALHTRRWCSHGGSTFACERAWEFHLRLAARWLRSGKALLPFLQVQDRMIAGCYGFLEGDCFYHYQIGWDQAYAEHSLGNLAVKHCLESCLELGVRRYEMLSGEYRYKSEWCPQARWLADVEGYAPNSAKAAAFLGLRSLKRWMAPEAAVGSRGREDGLLASGAEVPPQTEVGATQAQA
jgi:CelD/BcsL family acetyltransferase involved in cellulose biosynthesis